MATPIDLKSPSMLAVNRHDDQRREHCLKGGPFERASSFEVMTGWARQSEDRASFMYTVVVQECPSSLSAERPSHRCANPVDFHSTR